jgi:dTDP-4-dehydrorhamnose reductase
MTTLLLLGAGGQVGQEIIARASAFRIDVVARSRAQTDITQAEAVSAAIDDSRPDAVLNAGAYVKVDKAESESEEAHRVNGLGPAILAKACAAADVPLIHFSTDYVFDGKKGSSYIENDRPEPLNVYGASKLAGEEAIRTGHRKHLILRTSWVYGRYGTNFLKTMLRRATESDELQVVSDQRGSPTSTRDIADTVLELMPRVMNGVPWGTYHFSGQGEASWYQFATEIFDTYEKWTGTRPRLKAIASDQYRMVARRPLNSVLDNTLFRTTFRLGPGPWRNSVRQTVDELMGLVQA